MFSYHSSIKLEITKYYKLISMYLNKMYMYVGGQSKKKSQWK